MDSGEPALVPQWLRSGVSNSSKSGQQIRGEGVWVRSRSDWPHPEYTAGKANPRYEFSGRGGAESGLTPRRPPDRPCRGQRYGFREARAGSFSAGSDLFNDREPTLPCPGPGPGASRNEARRALTRSLSENIEQGVQDLKERARGAGRGRVGGHQRSTTVTDFGRDGGFAHGAPRNRSSSGCRVDGLDSDTPTETIAGEPHRAGQTGVRRRKASTSATAVTFEKDFPSLRNGDSRSNSPSGRASAWLGQPGANQGQWTSRLAEAPSGRYRQEREGEHRLLSGSQSARMVDAKQNNSLELTQQSVADKQRLEVKQSRMMIPVVSVQSKTKVGHKATGPRRNEKDRDAKLYSSMMSTAAATVAAADDVQKEGTVVLGRRTGVLPKMNISLVEAPLSLNGVVQETQLGELSFGDSSQHHQKSLSAGRSDFNVIQQRQRLQERERNRNSFYDMLKKKSTVPTGRTHSGPVKRAVSEPTGRMKSFVAQSLNPSVLQGSVKQAGGNDLATETGEVKSLVCGTMHMIQTGDYVSAEEGLAGAHVDSPKGKEKISDQDNNMCLWVPPSAEEERLLREMGWQSDQDDDEDVCLTEEEIAAFRAQQRKKQRSQSSVLSPIQCCPPRVTPTKLCSPSGFAFADRVGALASSGGGAQVQ